MPQINLLTNETKGGSLPFGKVLNLLAKVFAVAFFLLIGYYGYLWYQSKSVVGQILAKQNSIIQTQEAILNHKDRKELLTRQGQLKELGVLLSGHPYWSKIFPELARVTLKSAYYTGLAVEGEGVATMTVIVPTYTEFDNFLQVFDLEEFNQQFSDVSVKTVSKYQLGGVNGVKFEVQLKYHTDFLKQSTIVK